MSAKITLNVAHTGATINKNIYGHFSEHLGRCIYGGLFVGEDSPIPNKKGMRTDVVEALKHIKVPVLRWPGGCFADEYHWEDGIGPKASRRPIINNNWGAVVEDNSFGTHEFMELCEQIGCEAYISANVGSGTVREMAEWVEYLNADAPSATVKRRWQNGRKAPWGVRYLGVGNEPYGCGGEMTAEHYASEFRRYQNFARNYGDRPLCRIACGGDEEWTDTVLRIAGNKMDAISVHAYVHLHSFTDKGSATAFTQEEYYLTLRRAWEMEGVIRSRLNILEKYDPEHRIGLSVDEWGTWFDCEPGTNPAFLYQQNTMRDALAAAVTLNIFNSHADRIVMANIAQIVNVLQAMILTDGDDMLLTPTYHVFDLYKAHQDATLLPAEVACGSVGGVRQISASASVKDGVITLTIANLSCTGSETVDVSLSGASAGKITARILTGDMHAKNTFQEKNTVSIAPFDGVEATEDGLRLTLPRCSVAEVSLRQV